jgi:phage shock protein C
MKKKIYRVNDEKMAEGVCGGLARYFGIDVSIVRFVWLLLCLAGGIGIWLYLICTLAMPKEQN